MPVQPPAERAFLVGIERRDRPGLLPVEESLAELAQLARTAGLAVVGQTYQRLRRPDPATFIGSGKVEEVKALLEETAADVVIFDEELSPRHQRELERAFGEEIKVLDRTALILDIFAQHAHTREGALQVELAQYEYRLPRLTRQWTHLARQVGGRAGGATGGVGVRGPGETQLEVDRRRIRERIAHLKRELEAVRAHRARYRSRRRRAAVPVVALVGYTNAGKSTLLNALSGADVLVEDKLFATLDPTTRRVALPGGQTALFTDTVGFIQKLPTQLVAAFRATLEEIAEADLLIHVLDVTHPHALAQKRAVEETLREIGAGSVPVILALNKVDLLPEGERWVADGEVVPSAFGLPAEGPNPGPSDERLALLHQGIPISAAQGWGLTRLLSEVQTRLFEAMAFVVVHLPYRAGDLIALFHEQGVVEEEQHEPDGVMLMGRLPHRLLVRFRPYVEQAMAPAQTLEE